MKYLDIIAKLGVSGAHPGSMQETIDLLNRIQIPLHSRILEVGCGTGESACYLAGKGYQVTALDKHPLMLQKAKERAEKVNAKVHWVEGDIELLPFENDSFDMILAESVTVFTEIPTALREYYRVLKPNGRLVDCEISLLADIPDRTYQSIIDFLGIQRLPNTDEWVQAMQSAGFHVSLPISLREIWSPSTINAEPQEIDIAMLYDPAIAEGIFQYFQLIISNHEYFGVGTFLAEKPKHT